MKFNFYVHSAINPGKRKTKMRINKNWKVSFSHMTNLDSAVTSVSKVTDNSAKQTIQYVRVLCGNKVHSFDSIGRPEVPLFVLNHRPQTQNPLLVLVPMFRIHIIILEPWRVCMSAVKNLKSTEKRESAKKYSKLQ